MYLLLLDYFVVFQFSLKCLYIKFHIFEAHYFLWNISQFWYKMSFQLCIDFFNNKPKIGILDWYKSLTWDEKFWGSSDSLSVENFLLNRGEGGVKPSSCGLIYFNKCIKFLILLSLIKFFDLDFVRVISTLPIFDPVSCLIHCVISMIYKYPLCLENTV